MKFRLHFEYKDFEDYIDIKGETIEEIRQVAFREMNRRGVDTSQCWSEEL